jgi:hypothetical protein|tara:strand:+ start:8404 stop:8640 length:237 start_codon:yes stop_codon:yes gene_type:complete
VVKYTKGEKMQLSNQALGAIMLALQESLLEQTDIVPVLKGFTLQESGEGLIITNPPTVRFTDNTEVTNQDLENMVADK